LQAKNRTGTFSNGERKMLVSPSLDPKYDMRVTDFDAKGPVGHREYSAGDKEGLRREVFQALAGGFKAVPAKDGIAGPAAAAGSAAAARIRRAPARRGCADT